MRHRVTYLRQAGEPFDKNSLQVAGTALKVNALKAAKEHRFSIGLQELPVEVKAALEQSQELFIRWASQENYASIPPFVSRVSPGLHVFLTPQRGSAADLMCPALKSVFGEHLKCRSQKDSFSKIPMISERFSSSTSSQYYHLLPSLHDFVYYLQDVSCDHGDTSCSEAVSTVESATYIDVDYDAISHVLVINSFWNAAPEPNGWTETLEHSSEMDRLEVGVLENEKPSEPEELSLGGFLTVIGKDDKPAPTRFSFPSRHHPLPDIAASYVISFPRPTGLHPTLRISLLPSSLTPPSSSCALHTYVTLPSYLFADRYQLSDPLFLSSRNILNLRSIYGETNLEDPEWAIKQWGSALLLELATPTEQGVDVNIDIPLHLRYLAPTRGQEGLREVQIPWPVVFWACDADDGLKMGVNPFDRIHLGYDGLFGPKTMFYHWLPRPLVGGNATLVETLSVPVLDLDRTQNVERGTVVVVLLGLVWVCWKLLRSTMMQPSPRGSKAEKVS